MNTIHDDEYFTNLFFYNKDKVKKEKSFESKIKEMYRNQIARCKTSHYKKIGVKVEWSLEEFTSWMESNKERYDAIKKAGHSPSVDRIDNKGNYNSSNCRLLPLKLNTTLGRITSLQKQLKELYAYCDSMKVWF